MSAGRVEEISSNLQCHLGIRNSLSRIRRRRQLTVSEKVQVEIGVQMSRLKSIRVAWLLTCIVVLCWWMYSYGLKEDLPQVLRSESQIYLLIAMAILTIPLGIPWIYVFAGLLYLLESLGMVLGGKWQADVIFMWMGFVVIGYIQWFVTVPFLIRKIRKRNSTANQVAPTE